MGASTTLVRSLLSMMKCANSPFQSTRASMIAVLLFACACSASYEGVVNTPEDHHSQMVHPDVDGLNEMELGQGPVMQGQQPVQVPAAQMQNQPQMMGAGMGLNSQFHYSGSQSAGKNGKEDFYGPQYISTFHQQPGMMGGMGMGMGMGMMGGAMMGFPHYVHVAAPFPFLPQPYAYEHTWGMGLGMTGQYQPKYYGDYGHRGWHIRGGFNHQQWGRNLNGAKKYQTTGEWYHSGKRKGKQGPDVQMYGEHGYGHWRYGYRKKSMRHGYGQPMVGLGGRAGAITSNLTAAWDSVAGTVGDTMSLSLRQASQGRALYSPTQLILATVLFHNISMVVRAGSSTKLVAMAGVVAMTVLTSELTRARTLIVMDGAKC